MPRGELPGPGGVVIIVLGGIGASSVTRVFVRQKIWSIAVMKCVGGTSGQMLAVYLLQIMVLGLAGSLFGVALARGALTGLSAFCGFSARPRPCPACRTA